MPGAGKKGVKYSESGKSSSSMKDSGSELIASLKFKKGRKISKSKNLQSNSKCQSNTVNSSLLKGTVTESPSKGTGDDSARRKSVNQKSLHKFLEKIDSKKLSSFKLKGEISAPVISSGGGEEAHGDGETQKFRMSKKKKKKKKRQMEKAELDEASRLKRRSRYLMIKMKLEQNLIDAYSGEGWKGQSREKIRPEKELLRAKKQILKCKLGIRDAIRQLDSISSVGSIEGSVIAADGSVHHEHIICAKCKLREAFPDNDIVLCDGTCNCAFHQKCLDPPLETESIPPGDQGWFCKLCECKMDIIESVNAHIGTCFSVDSSWQDIFKEDAAFPECNALLNQEEDWPSDDSEDDDYNPDRKENSCNISAAGTDDDASSSSRLNWSSDDESFSESMRWEMEGNGYNNYSVDSSMGSDETSDGEIICGRRQRRKVDYRKLYDEMFGKDASAIEQISEDEDWGPAKKRRKEKESDAVNTLMTLYGSDEKCEKAKTEEVEKKLPSNGNLRRPLHKMPPNALEKLRQVFAENELPSRIVKENLSEELGLEREKVNKWFKNARYMALKTRKVDSQLHCSPRISEDKLETEKTSEDVLKLKDAFKETLICSPKSLKFSSSVKKKQPKTAVLVSPVNNIQVSTELSDDVSLKKLLKGKSKRAKKVNFVATGKSQAAEAEMERMCHAKRRLEHLKQTLSRLQNENGKKSNNNHLQECVVYVPIAELREKL